MIRNKKVNEVNELLECIAKITDIIAKSSEEINSIVEEDAIEALDKAMKGYREINNIIGETVRRRNERNNL